jgi:hypothetical protein
MTTNFLNVFKLLIFTLFNLSLLILTFDLANQEGVLDLKGCEDMKCHCRQCFWIDFVTFMFTPSIVDGLDSKKNKS